MDFTLYYWTTPNGTPEVYATYPNAEGIAQSIRAHFERKEAAGLTPDAPDTVLALLCAPTLISAKKIGLVLRALRRYSHFHPCDRLTEDLETLRDELEPVAIGWLLDPTTPFEAHTPHDFGDLRI